MRCTTRIASRRDSRSHVQRASAGRQRSDERPALDVGLGHETAMASRVQCHDVEPGNVVRHQQHRPARAGVPTICQLDPSRFSSVRAQACTRLSRCDLESRGNSSTTCARPQSRCVPHPQCRPARCASRRSTALERARVNAAALRDHAPRVACARIALATRWPRLFKCDSSPSRDSTAASRRPRRLQKLIEADQASPLEDRSAGFLGAGDGAAKQRFGPLPVGRREIGRDHRLHATQLRFEPSAAFGHQLHGTFACRGRVGEPADPTLGVRQIRQVTGLGQPELDRIECGDRLGDHRDALSRISALAERPADESRRLCAKTIAADAARQAREGSSPPSSSARWPRTARTPSRRHTPSGSPSNADAVRRRPSAARRGRPQVPRPRLPGTTA